MQIRAATTDDIEPIVRVFLDCWKISYINLLPEEVREAMDFDAALKLWRNATEPHPERVTYVVEVHNTIIAVARAGVDPAINTRGHLFSLYVDPACAGRGYGRALLTHIKKVIRDRGLHEMSLWVFKDNVLAQALYSSEGFMATGSTKTDPRWKIPEIEMIATVKL